MINRRGFLSALLGTASALALDQEKALWIPGKKLISIPKAPEIVTTGWAGSKLQVGDIITIAGIHAIHPQTRVQLPFLQQFVITRPPANQQSPEVWPMGGLGLWPTIEINPTDVRQLGVDPPHYGLEEQHRRIQDFYGPINDRVIKSYPFFDPEPI